MRRRPLLLAALAAPAARAQSWPSRPLRLLVPVSAGGSVDALARQISRHLGPLIVQAIAIENNGAGGGDVAFEAVARAAPDGHTLLTGWDSLAINPAVYPRVAFDPLVDFAPIIHLVSGAEVLAVKPELPGGAGVS